jgi:hypothetical protein
MQQTAINTVFMKQQTAFLITFGRGFYFYTETLTLKKRNDAKKRKTFIYHEAD